MRWGRSYSRVGAAILLHWLSYGSDNIGGFVLQWPAGMLSDRFDRRLILAFMSLATAGVALGIIWLAPRGSVYLMGLITLFGGFSFTLYPLSISHTSDRVAQEDLVATTASLLLIYSIGSIIGPLLAPFLMAFFGAIGLMLFKASLATLLAFFAVWRRTQRASVPLEAKAEFVPLPRTGPISHELNPQLEPVSETVDSKRQ